MSEQYPYSQNPYSQPSPAPQSTGPYPAQSPYGSSTPMPQSPGAFAGAGTADKLNIFGLIGIIPLVLHTLSGIIPRVMYRASDPNYTFISILDQTLFWVLILIALALGIVGLLQKNATRLRWTAYGVTFTAGFLLCNKLFWLVTNPIINLIFPYEY